MQQKFSLYLGGAFAQFTPAEVLARQQQVIDRLDAGIHVYKPKHQGAYPASLGDDLDAVLTTRDRLLFQRADLIVLDFLGAKEVSRGSVLEMGGECVRQTAGADCRGGKPASVQHEPDGGGFYCAEPGKSSGNC